jgi:hypothetical protein
VSITLSYSPASTWEGRRRVIRKIGYGLIATIAMACAVMCLRVLTVRLADMRMQAPLEQFTYPPGHVVYADRPGSHPGTFVATIVENPAAWCAFQPIGRPRMGSGLAEATLFLHELRSPAGERRIVRVSCYTIGARWLYCPAQVIVPGSVFSPPSGEITVGTLLPLDLHRGQAGLTVYGGQPDPADPHHFTIAYDYGNAHGIVDGWLEANDSVKLEPRL